MGKMLKKIDNKEPMWDEPWAKARKESARKGNVASKLQDDLLTHVWIA